MVGNNYLEEVLLSFLEEKQKYIFEAFLDADRQAAVLQRRPCEPQNLQDFGKLAVCSSQTGMMSVLTQPPKFAREYSLHAQRIVFCCDNNRKATESQQTFRFSVYIFFFPERFIVTQTSFISNAREMASAVTPRCEWLEHPHPHPLLCQPSTCTR